MFGYKKHELLAEMLSVLGKGRHFNGLVATHVDILRQIVADWHCIVMTASSAYIHLAFVIASGVCARIPAP